MEVNIGCMRNGDKSWKGNFFPNDLTDKDFLIQYSKHFDCVLFKATHYQIPKPGQIEAWVEKVSANPKFKFFPLFPQAISHVRRFRNAGKVTKDFLNTINVFGDKLGPCLLTIGANITPAVTDDLLLFLNNLPKDLQFFVDFRNEKWYHAESLRQILAAQVQLGFGLAINDTVDQPDLKKSFAPKKNFLVQFNGTGDYSTDFKRLESWADTIKQWDAEGVESAAFFITSKDIRAEPELCTYLKKLIAL